MAKGSTILALVLTLSFVAPHPSVARSQTAPPVFSVFVAAPMRDGFQDVSKDTSDTISDISDAVKRDKRLRLVTRKEDADVVLVVIGRGVGSDTFGQRTQVYRNYYGGTSVQSLPMVANTRWITTVLISGTYQREFAAAQTNTSAFSWGAWSVNAGTIVDNIGAWVATNADTLLARRGKVAGTEAATPPASAEAPTTGSQKAAVPLTLDQVIQMSTAKLPDDLIIAAIQNAGAKFDLTPETMLKLKGAGVSDAVIRALGKGK